MRVLLAEDNALVRKALAAGLMMDGHDVMVAEDGERALELAQLHPPDFIISDVLMPRMDGFSLCQAVREDAQLHDIPVIFYSTTFLDPEDQALASSVGANGFIPKDSDPDSFRRQLRELIDANIGTTQAPYDWSPQSSDELKRLHAAALIRKLHKKVTELEEEREALNEKERFLNQVLTTIPDVVFVVKLPGLIPVFVAPEAERLAGYLGRELTEDSGLWLTLVHQEDRQRVLREIDAAIAARKRAVIVARVVNKQGELHWIEGRISPRLDEQGTPVELVGALTDITQRKQAEEQLIASEQRYRNLFEMMENGLAVQELVFDASGQAIDYRFLEINPAFERLTGLTREKVIGHTIREVDPSIEEAWIKEYVHVAVSGIPARFIRYIAMLDRSFEVVAYRLDAHRFVTQFTDVTEQRRVDERVRNLARFPEEDPSPVLRINGVGEILYANPASNELLNRCQGQQGGGDCSDLLTSAMSALQNNSTGYFDYPVQDKYYSFVVTPMVDAGYANLYGRDISDQVKASQDLEHLNRVLRTLSKSNRTLVHAGTEEELLSDVCSVLVEEGGYPYVWLASVDAEGPCIRSQYQRHLTTLQAWLPHFVSSTLMAAQINAALKQQEPLLISDLSGAGETAEQQRQLEEVGLAVLLLLPVVYKEEHFGVIGIFSRTKDIFDPQEMELLNEMAGDVAYGIQALRTKTAHEKGTARIQETMLQTIEAVSRTLEKRDPYTAGHQLRVVQLAVAIARELGLSNERIEGIRLGGLVHDIGKIYVPAEILNRPGRLTDAEFGIIKSHPEVGYDILKDVAFDWPIAEMVLQHHERFDGSGYPKGLKGEAIVLEARILGVADVVEAITSHRPYRPGLGLQMALDEIATWRGIRYDPQVVDACLHLFQQKGFTWEQGETLTSNERLSSIA